VMQVLLHYREFDAQAASEEKLLQRSFIDAKEVEEVLTHFALPDVTTE
jgi:hypothetical protein